ncbi:MAG: ribonuclease PH [Oligoflexia bacterium]|nr:ribonuclease PH [Oligoflexia bacterium]
MTNKQRSFERTNHELRPIVFDVGVNRYAEGSCMVSFGYTKVHCTASVEKSVPSFLKGKGEGWVTAEYSMLPRATHTRSKRDREKVSGRTSEIQRLIGRAIRASVDFGKLGEQTIMLDCDVIQADGGTRTASICGAYVAMAIAIERIKKKGDLASNPIIDSVAAVSIGIHQGSHLLDLDYEEDSSCEVDLNLVMTGSGQIVEVQGTAERAAFSQDDLMKMVSVGGAGLQKIKELQRLAIDKGIRLL